MLLHECDEVVRDRFVDDVDDDRRPAIDEAEGVLQQRYELGLLLRVARQHLQGSRLGKSGLRHHAPVAGGARERRVVHEHEATVDGASDVDLDRLATVV